MYILIWDINDYCEMGGGSHYEEFEKVTDMDVKINSLHKKYGDLFSITYAIEVGKIFKYEPTEVITKYKRI